MVADLPQKCQLLGMLIGAAVVPFAIFNPKMVSADNAFVVKAVLAGIGGGIGAVVGRVLGVLLDSVASRN
jgi:hypothetical protein